MINEEQLGRIYVGAYLLADIEPTKKTDYQIKIVADKVMSYCNRNDIPVELEDIIAQIASKALTSDNEQGNLTSYREGDTSWSWDYNPQNNIFNEINILENFRCIRSI